MASLPTNASAFRVPRLDDSAQRLAYKKAAAIAESHGVAGLEWVSDSSAHDGVYASFTATTDSVISAITYAAWLSVVGSPSGVTVKAGTTIYGPMTSFTLTSGSGVLYNSLLG